MTIELTDLEILQALAAIDYFTNLVNQEKN
jgi:hypothetical protein